jgi:hypothetical protein
MLRQPTSEDDRVSLLRRQTATRTGLSWAGFVVVAVALGSAGALASSQARQPDGPPLPAGYTWVGTVQVPIASSKPAKSPFTLRPGVTYLLRISGTFFTGGAFADAEYFFGGPVATPQDFDRPRGNVDYGVAIDDLSMAPGHRKSPYWGKLTSSHVYSARIVGMGRPILVDVHDTILGDNVPLPRVPGTGPLMLRVYAPPNGS